MTESRTEVQCPGPGFWRGPAARDATEPPEWADSRGRCLPHIHPEGSGKPPAAHLHQVLEEFVRHSLACRPGEDFQVIPPLLHPLLLRFQIFQHFLCAYLLAGVEFIKNACNPFQAAADSIFHFFVCLCRFPCRHGRSPGIFLRTFAHNPILFSHICHCIRHFIIFVFRFFRCVLRI